MADDPTDTEQRLAKISAEVTAKFDGLSAAISALTDIVQEQQEWIRGITRAAVAAEFRHWFRLASVSPNTKDWTEDERTRKAAEIAFDHFSDHCPPTIRAILAPERDGMIEFLLDAADELRTDVN